MEAAKRLVYKGEGGLWSVKEERVVIAADEAIEGSELRWRQALCFPWCDVMILRKDTRSVHILKVGVRRERESHNVIRDTQQKLFKYWCRALVWSYQITPVFVCSYRGAHRSCSPGL